MCSWEPVKLSCLLSWRFISSQWSNSRGEEWGPEGEPLTVFGAYMVLVWFFLRTAHYCGAIQKQRESKPPSGLPLQLLCTQSQCIDILNPYLLLNDLSLYCLTPTCSLMTCLCIHCLTPTCSLMTCLCIHCLTPTCSLMTCLCIHCLTPTCSLMTCLCIHCLTPTCSLMTCLCIHCLTPTCSLMTCLCIHCLTPTCSLMTCLCIRCHFGWNHPLND